MVADHVSFRFHALNDLRIFLDKITYDEKGRRHFFLLQHVKELLRHAVFIAGVKGQIDFFRVRIAGSDIIGLKLREVFRCRVADRRAALLLKR